MDEPIQKFFIYARKSTDDLSRQIRSIDDQIAELRELAKREERQVVDVLIEKQTAKVAGRPIFNRMLDRIEEGEAAGILSWHPDRLSRNSLDAGRIIHLIDTGKIKALRFPTMDFDPTATGKFMLAIMFGQSKYYVDNLSENIKRGHRQKVKNGIWPMVAPVGYLNDHSAKTINPDSQRAPLVRKAFELYAAGTFTIDRLMEAVNGLGLTNRHNEPLSRAQYHRLLSNPIYCGIIDYGGERHEGRHEPIVTKKLFDAAQEVICRKSKPKAPKLKPYLYRGMFRCGECGCFITTETQKGFNYLRCTKRVKKDCSQPYLREDELSRQLTSALYSFCISEDWANWIITEFEAERDAAIHAADEAVSAVREKIQILNEKLSRLMDAYLEQVLSVAEYRQQKAKLIDQKRLSEDEVVALAKNGGSWFEPAIRFIKAAKQTVFLAKGDNDVEKRDFLKKNGSNLILIDRRLKFEGRGAWENLVNHGRLAQANAAPKIFGAASFGKSDQDLLKRRRRDSNP